MLKKLFRSGIALILVMAMCLEVFPAQVFASSASGNASSQTQVMSAEQDAFASTPSDIVGKEITDDDIVCELTDKREEKIKHFRLTDGSSVAAVYDTPVHELDSNGNWVDIDNRLTVTGANLNSAYAKEDGSSKISLASSASSGNMLTVQADGYTIKWGLNISSRSLSTASFREPEPDTDSCSKMSTNSISGIVSYKDVMSGVSLTYQLIGNDIKENIILSKASAAQPFTFTLICDGLTAKLENNNILLCDKDGSIVRVISAPYMMDANDNMSSDIVVMLGSTLGGYTVTLVPDADWLSAPDRAYPVVIDPIITKTYTNSTVDNTSVNSKNPTSNAMYQYGALYVGRESSSYNNLRGVFKFTLPTNITESDMIIDAHVKLTQRNYFSSSSDSVTVNIHQITSNLPLSSLTWNQLNGKYSSTVLDSQIASASTKEQHFRWDITAAVKSWYLNGNNYGLALVSENENGAYKYATFYTSRYTGITAYQLPSATIVYLNHDGLEDYLTYHQAGNDRMGTISVGDFNGNLIYTYTDLAMDGNYLPVTIQHVYNHSRRGESELAGGGMHYGVGMRLNLSQRIEAANLTGYTYKYTDADGTIHYFSKSDTDSTLHEKEFDTTTTIKVESNGTYTLTDGSTLSYKFNSSGFLTSIVDSSNNKSMTLTYTNGILTKVTDGAGRQTTLTYDANNYLTRITDPAGRVVYYAYSNGILAHITRTDGQQVRFLFTGDDAGRCKLSRIYDADNSYIDIAYYSASPRRVQSLTEYGKDGTEGNKLTWTYTPGETTVTDRSGKSETMMFDYSGHTVCVRDSEGNAVFGSYNNTSDNKKNTLAYQSNMQSSVTNLLKNHDFEDSSATPWGLCSITAEGSATLSTSVKYAGSKSYTISCTGQTGSYGHAQYMTGQPGGTYTFSVYVKTENIQTTYGGVIVAISYIDSNSVLHIQRSYVRTSSDWQRISVTETVPSNYKTGTFLVLIGFENATGTAYFDNAQMETGAVASRYNLLDNGHFRDAVGSSSAENWIRYNCSTTNDVVVAGRTGSGFKLTGEDSKYKCIFQSVAMSGNEGDTYVFGAWAKGLPVSKVNIFTGINRMFGVEIRFYKSDGTYKAQEFHFEAKTPNWQYLSGSATAPYAYTKVEFHFMYNRQKNYAIFDDAQLYREEFGQRLTYDDDGRLTKSVDSMGRATTYEYLAAKRPEISKITYADGTTTTYNYDSATRRLLSVTDANGKVTTYNYDSNGNPTGASMTADGLTMSGATTAYSGSYVSTITDSLGNTVSYNYNQNTGILNSVTDPRGTVTTYTHNQYNDNLTKVAVSESDVDYTYNYGVVRTITHNTDDTAANDVKYTFEYDEFGNTKSVLVGTQPLITHTYAANNGLLTRSDYGNGAYTSPTYDSLDRVTAMSYNGVEKFNWIYGKDGNIGIHNDLVNNITWRYEYTKNGDVTSAIGSNGTRFNYTYDTATGKLLSVKATSGGVEKTTTYNYSDHTSGEDANLIESVVIPTATITYDYDGFYRASYDVEVNNADVLTTDFTFLNGTADNSTTTAVGSMTNASNGWSETTSYTYDDNGNIETVSEGGVQKAKYYYDELNQLVREDNVWLNKTIAYTYDKGGNILAVNEYDYTAGSLDGFTSTTSNSYTYSDTNWKDKLTAYNGNAITYDAIGNPLSYYNGFNFTWQHGRQLASISGDGLTASYKYDAEGIRTQKTVNGVTTNYVLEGDTVVKETNGTDTLWYYYDVTGGVISFELNGTAYFYVKNMQGDIVAITDASGNKVVEYTYDSWGKIISITGSLADTVGVKNPYRYRSYRYDTETGLYYLQSRYYDPNTCRFINADGLINAGGDVLGSNIFIYCANDPINKIDPTGRIFERIKEKVTAIIASKVSGFISKAKSKVSNFIEKQRKKRTQLIVAQTIYGEEHGRTSYTDWQEGQTAVAIVIQNRLNAQISYMGKDLETICTNGQFDGYTAGYKAYKEGECDSMAWDHAMYLAERVVNNEVIDPPAGITSKHLFFNKTSTFNYNISINGGKFSFGSGTIPVKPLEVIVYGGNTFFYY